MRCSSHTTEATRGRNGNPACGLKRAQPRSSPHTDLDRAHHCSWVWSKEGSLAYHRMVSACHRTYQTSIGGTRDAGTCRSFTAFSLALGGTSDERRPRLIH